MNVNYTNHNHRIVDACNSIKFPSLDSSPHISKLFSTLSAISRKNGPEIGTQEFKSNDSDSLLHTPPLKLGASLQSLQFLARNRGTDSF